MRHPSRPERGGTTDSGPGRWIDTQADVRLWVGVWSAVWGRLEASAIWLSDEPKDAELNTAVSRTRDWPT